MSDHCEVIDLTESENRVPHNFNLLTDEIIEIEESDSSFIEGSKNLPRKRSRTKNQKADSLKKNRLTVTETPEKKIGECPICCEQLGKKPVSSTKCGHVFCFECIKTSLKHNKKCPQCRETLKGASAVHPLYLPLK